MKLSVILITHNEELDLPSCLESLQGLDAEIIVLDNFSSDATLEIAKRYTPHVFSKAFTDYASQKQAALELATREWVLSMDADERISPELKREIQDVVSHEAASQAYLIPFEVHFLGRRLRFGGLGREKHVRLFRRQAGVFQGGLLHEGISVRGPIGKLSGSMRHFPYRDIGEYLRKMETYTTYAAQKRLEQGLRFIPIYHALPLWEFFVRTVLRLGFLDGTPGLVWAGLSAFHTWIKYVKLRELQCQRSGQS